MNCPKCGYATQSEYCPSCGTPIPHQNQSPFSNQDPFSPSGGNYNSQNAGYNPQGGYNQQGGGYNPQSGYNPQNGGGYNPTDTSVYTNGNEKSSSGNKNALIIAIIAVAAVIVVCLVAIVITLANNNSNNNSVITTQSTTQSTTQTTVPDTTTTSVYTPSGYTSPDYAVAEYTQYVTADVGLILRRDPYQSDTNKVYTIKYRQAVTVMGRSNYATDWVYVRHNGNYGWVNSQYLSSSMPSAATTRSNSYSSDEYFSYTYSWGAYVKPSAGLNIRSRATTSAYSYAVLPKGTYLTVLGYSAYNNDWYYVSAYYKGTTYYGFVHSDYVS